MTIECKPYEDLTPDDLAVHPVWEFALDMEGVDESLVRPVSDLPASDLSCRVVGTRVRFANGTSCWALIQNIDPHAAEATRHLLSLTLLQDSEPIYLARYHDFNQESYGPAALSRKLGLSLDDVFPISYDVNNCCVGDPRALAGTIEADPKDKLTNDEIFQLIVGKKSGA